MGEVRHGRPFQAALDARVEGLDGVDRRLAHEIAAGVLRRRRELDAVLALLVSRDWRRTPDDLKDLLRVGAYQLLYLSRVPAYAAVQATVEVAKSRHGAPGGGLVNAVLRRLVREQGKGDPRSAPLMDSHPAWLVKRWTGSFGEERTQAILRHNQTRPPITLRPIAWSRERLAAALTDRGIPWRGAPFGPGVSIAPCRIHDLPGFREGAFVVQDPAQARLLEHAGIPDGARVWDACAAPGGKSAVLSLRSSLIASDLPRRLRALRETLARVGADVPLMAADARRPPLKQGSVEVVLLDAPCSGTGVMARHPDARWRLSPSRIRAAVRRQAELLDGSARVVPRGGVLVYMTCSLEREENVDQVTAFLQRRSDFSLDGVDLSVIPTDAGTDGGYVARLRRR